MGRSIERALDGHPFHLSRIHCMSISAHPQQTLLDVHGAFDGRPTSPWIRPMDVCGAPDGRPTSPRIRPMDVRGAPDGRPWSTRWTSNQSLD
jgi:hypothetical protein